MNKPLSIVALAIFAWLVMIFLFAMALSNPIAFIFTLAALGYLLTTNTFWNLVTLQGNK